MVKAAVLGAAGGIGQPLSLLLKLNPLVTELALYDLVATPGVAADLSHIATPAKVEGYLQKDEGGLKKTLEGCDIVVIPAGIPRKPGMTRDDLFKINAGIVKGLATEIAETCPKAFVLVISNPVNSTVPIVAEVLKSKGVYDPKRVFGVTTLDVVRASTFVAQDSKNLSAAPTTTVPVIGGHSGITIIPLLSQTQPPLSGSPDIATLTNRIQFGGDEVVKAKDGAGSATLSMAQAGYQFADWVIQAVGGKTGIVTQSYIDLAADPTGGDDVKKALGTDGQPVEIDYFSVSIQLGPAGVEKILPIGAINAYEKGLIDKAIPELKTNIANGANFVLAPKL